MATGTVMVSSEISASPSEFLAMSSSIESSVLASSQVIESSMIESESQSVLPTESLDMTATEAIEPSASLQPTMDMPSVVLETPSPITHVEESSEFGGENSLDISPSMTEALMESTAGAK